jgi:hypothetical protein
VSQAVVFFRTDLFSCSKSFENGRISAGFTGDGKEVMSTVRFSKIVETAGKPNVHLLWIDPEKDATLQKAIRALRVMTVHQGAVGTKTDFAVVGYEKNVTGQILIFPKSLKQFAGKRVIGVKYDLLEWPDVPKAQQAHLAKPVKIKPPKTKVAAVPAAENVPDTVVKFPSPMPDHVEQAEPDVEEIKNQVRQAMKLLEEGKQVAAFNFLRRILDS